MRLVVRAGAGADGADGAGAAGAGGAGAAGVGSAGAAGVGGAGAAGEGGADGAGADGADLRHATVALEEPDDFGRFAVIDGTGDGVALGEAIAGHGRLTDGGDVFVAIDALLALAGDRADDPAWRAGFDQMVAFARGHGWLDEAGTAIRAHVEPLG